MRVLHQDARENLIRLRVETVDDMWHLANLVERGDLATGTGYREPDKATKGKEREGKVEKKPMTLTIRVESVEYANFSNRLRVLGVIVAGAQDVGQHHTLSLEEHSEIALQKTRGWKEHDLERVKQAVEDSKRPRVVFLAMEENEAVVAILRAFGVQRMAEVFGHVSGKRYESAKGAEDAFFDEILLALRDYRPTDAPLMIVGPGFAKERFLKYAREKQSDLVKGAVTEGTGQAGMTGVNEAIRRGMVDRVAKDQRVAEETKVVDRLLEGIATNGAATYGAAHVDRALDAGAVEQLLVTDLLLREKGDALMEKARATGAKAMVVSHVHDAGRELQALGGVGAILRYKLAD